MINYLRFSQVSYLCVNFNKFVAYYGIVGEGVHVSIINISLRGLRLQMVKGSPMYPSMQIQFGI